jgi:acyl-CoA reductase-like NAD-dependent aldehyde dehydrogenase
VERLGHRGQGISGLGARPFSERSRIIGRSAQILVFSAKDENEAIAIANDSPFGFGGSVYSSDIERAKRVALAVWERAWS